MSLNNFYIKWEVRNQQMLNADACKLIVQDTIKQEDKALQSVTSNTKIVDAVAVNATADTVIADDQIQTAKEVITQTIKQDTVSTVSLQVKPLRPQADIYVQIDKAFEYSVSLPAFLVQKGLIIAPYKSEFSYKDDDIILLSDKNIKQEGSNVYYLNSDKKALWNFLKSKIAGLV